MTLEENTYEEETNAYVAYNTEYYVQYCLGENYVVKYWKEKEKTAVGKDRYIIKKTIIELSQDQYVVKSAFRNPIMTQNTIKTEHKIDFGENYYIDATLSQLSQNTNLGGKIIYIVNDILKKC